MTMRKLNPEHIAALIPLLNRSPYFDLLSMVLTDMGIGYSLVETGPDRKHFNPFGGVHGGVYASIIDTAAYWAVYCEQDENDGLITLDLKVDYLAPADGGKMIARGKSIKAGRTICLGEALVTDSRGRKLAVGTSKLMVTKRLQTVPEALETAEGEDLPPKFL